MKNLYLILFLLIPIKSFAHLTHDIDSILAKNQKTSFAIKIIDLKTEKEIYSYHPYQRMIPASVNKSLTAYAALKYLGPDFIYHTEIKIDQEKLVNNILEGDLYIKFTGDPSLTTDDLTNLISHLKIKTITGKIIIDDSIFDLNYFANGISLDDRKFCYSAPSSAIVVDKNCFIPMLSPGSKEGELAILSNNDKQVANINNEIITKNDENCSPELLEHPNNLYDLTGCLDIKNQPIPLNIAYQDPRLMISDLISLLVKEAGIDWKSGEIIFAKAPEKVKIISQHNSKPLSELIINMQQDSDNIAANNIGKTIAAHYYKKQGNFARAIQAIQEIINPETKIEFSDIRIFDASGQSRYNLIAPEDFIRLYSAAYRDKKLWSYFYKSLAVLGNNGTLKDRFIDIPHLHGKIYAKSGSMSGISSLVGYFFKDDGQILVFAIMSNNYVGPRKELENIIGEILNSLAIG